MDTNTIQIIKELGVKTDVYIQTISSKIGVGVDHFWPIYVKQQVFEGYAFFAIILFFIVIGMILVRLNRKMPFLDREHYGDPTIRMFTTVPGAVIFIIIGLFLMFYFNTNLTKILNPEYKALQEIIKNIK